jgi:FkbM family methyltransferase
LGSLIRQIARRVRHLPLLENQHGLWDAVRGPYHRLLNARGGASIDMPGGVTIRIPAEFALGAWEAYEQEPMRLVAAWARDHRNGLLLDIGCHLGIFSAFALFANPELEVVAFDSDLSSLAAVRRLCRHAPGSPRTIYGFVSDTGTNEPLTTAEAFTEATLRRHQPSGDLATTRYICVGDTDVADIPCHALDDLFPPETVAGRPLLIKCDVEGAELLVLHGARKLLGLCRPTLLLSVHPPALPRYGHTPEAVHAFLDDLGYRVAVVGIDHEEHWWCE